jgi:hypothetical protein
MCGFKVSAASRLAGWLGAILAMGCLSMVFVAPVRAAAPVADWSIHALATPSNFSMSDNARCLGSGLGACDVYLVTVRNAGSLASDGSEVTLSDTLPAGVTVQRVAFFWSGLPKEYGGPLHDLAEEGLCTTAPVQCELPTGEYGLPPIAPDDTLNMYVYVTVNPGTEGSLVDSATVSGGGAQEASTSVQNQVASSSPLFGVGSFVSSIAGVDGAPDTQAGAHPYDFTTRIDLNSVFRIPPDNDDGGIEATSVQDVKNVVVDLPLGFLGSALAAPKCTLAQLASGETSGEATAGCPADTQVGHIATYPLEGATGANGGLYNMVPEHGVAAEFGYNDLLKGTHVLYASVVSTPAGYVLRTTAPEIPQVSLDAVEVTLYGDPAVRDGTSDTPVAFFTNPSDCSGSPLVTSLHMDSWQHEGRDNVDGTPDFSDPNWVSSAAESPPVTGCNDLRFEPSLGAQPETGEADSPTGLGFELKVPQSETPGALATPPLRNAVVTLPAGMAVDPSAAGGLASCSLAQIGMSPSGEPNNSQPVCPEASKIGSVELETPALTGVLQGSIYLAAQNENPFGTLLAGYIVVDDPTTGVLVKIPGRIDPNPTTGQLVATFDENPQFPFSDLKLHFFGGPRAPLSTPAGCGSYTTNALLTPWSAPDSGPPASSSDSFQINTGCGGGFNPGFSSGMVDNQAGGFSAFTTTFSRQDSEQNLSGVILTVPPGLLGVLKGVERCPEPQASQGACGAGSLIGQTMVAAGSGPDPYWVQGGQVFLTGPYKGAPFGLSVVVPAVAGPFNLGNVVVRAAVNVDPHTAQITVVSDPLPTILDGIPLDVRTVSVSIDRSGFMFNPTSCASLAVNGVLSSAQGATVPVSSRFQAANCQGLPFHPVFTVSTQAKTSKHNGASLTVKGKFPTGNANIHSVAVILPKQLPARLTTIQQACPEGTFAANPATCPTGSMIGTATATTPILANPVVSPSISSAASTSRRASPQATSPPYPTHRSQRSS